MTTDAFGDMVRAIVRDELAKREAPPTYLSVKDAANVAAVTTATIRRWVREQRLPEFRAGREVRVRREDLDALLASGRRRPANEIISIDDYARKVAARIR